jgi:predicted lipoprotein with Yx(FWY)xxD motif
LVGAAAAVVAVALTVAACGGSSDKPHAGQAATGGGAASGASIALTKSDLGKILVDGTGRTLYLFEADKGGKSACSGACATSWPPLLTKGKPVAGGGVAAGKLGTTKRQDGQSQVTYNGHPLYGYAGDTSPGQTAGEGIDDFGAEWYVLARSGEKVAADGD